MLISRAPDRLAYPGKEVAGDSIACHVRDSLNGEVLGSSNAKRTNNLIMESVRAHK